MNRQYSPKWLLERNINGCKINGMTKQQIPDTYKGHAITYNCGHYGALGRFYKTLKSAKAVIDKYNNESITDSCECGCAEYFLSPIVGARCAKCRKPLSLKTEK